MEQNTATCLTQDTRHTERSVKKKTGAQFCSSLFMVLTIPGVPGKLQEFLNFLPEPWETPGTRRYPVVLVPVLAIL